ncbi:MAG: ABC transporter permease [Corynebacterium sp.]|nr:ABC transporter permease [Corynebacterium sp.]
MSIAEALSLALSNLRTSKLRSALTLLGVIIGIASVIAIVTMAAALRTQTLSGFSSLGATDYWVQVQKRPTIEQLDAAGGDDNYTFTDMIDDPHAGLTPQMLDDLKTYMGSDIQGVIIGDKQQFPARVNNGGRAIKMGVQTVNANFFTMRNVDITYGRAFSEDEARWGRPVVVIPTQLVDALFNGNPGLALGSTISVETQAAYVDFKIVGIEDNSTRGLMYGESPEAMIFVPYFFLSTFEHRLESIPDVAVRGSGEVDSQEMLTRLQRFFDQRYAANSEFRVKVHDSSSDLVILNQVMSSISIAIAGIAGISLLVGGIGVMNIMLITVTERTREIGVRKALGATRRDIRIQFLIEAMVVCFVGGILGILVGSAVGIIGFYVIGVVVLPPVIGIMASLLFCLAIGLFFGWYPANRAAKLDPIEALRYE